MAGLTACEGWIDCIEEDMRITGGSAKGIPLKAPKGLETRPTSDKVRQALFQTLGSLVCWVHVLDLFAGTGALGIEALSHGAEFAVFVEKSPSAIRIIEQNLAKTGFSSQADIIHADFRPALKVIHRRNQVFGLILIDPPYEWNFLDEAINLLQVYPILGPRGVIVTEHFKKVTPSPQIGDIALDRTRCYGQTALSYYFSSQGAI